MKKSAVYRVIYIHRYLSGDILWQPEETEGLEQINGRYLQSDRVRMGHQPWRRLKPRNELCEYRPRDAGVWLWTGRRYLRLIMYRDIII